MVWCGDVFFFGRGAALRGPFAFSSWSKGQYEHSQGSESYSYSYSYILMEHAACRALLAELCMDTDGTCCLPSFEANWFLCLSLVQACAFNALKTTLSVVSPLPFCSPFAQKGIG